MKFTVPRELDGITVKSFLRGTCRISARLHTHLKHIENGITVDGKLIIATDRLKAGDTVVLLVPDEEMVAPVQMPIDILFEDENIIVLNKKAGMTVHPVHGHLDDTLANAVSAYFASKGENCAFRPINRIDRDTSGIVLAAKNSFCAAQLQKSAEKVYYAVCQGELSGCGTIDQPIRVKEGHGIQREVGEGGERSVTHWKALCCKDGLTLLECRLETGRTHQIRVHFSSYMKMPLAGDDMYGGSRELISRQALHCGKMSFVHPLTNESVDIICDIPDDMFSLPPCREYFVHQGNKYS